MTTPDIEAISLFAEAGLSDEHLLNTSCQTLAQRYIHLFDSTLPWAEAVFKAQPSYPGRSQGWIASRWVVLDEGKKLFVQIGKNHGLDVRELS